MKLRTAMAMVVIVCGGASVTFFSCDKKAATSDSASTTTATATPQSTSKAVSSQAETFTSPQTLALDVGGATVDVPAGAFPDGTKLAVTVGTQPAEFAAVTGATGASVVLDVAATDAAGAVVPKATVPLTLALDVGEPAALTDVEKTAENLCVFGRGADSVFRVWRNAVITATANSVSYKAIWLGIYELYYCGTMPVPGALEVNEAGDDAAKVKATETAAGGGLSSSCNLTSLAAICEDFVGKLVVGIASNQSSCETSKGTYAGTACPTANSVGVCVSNYGTQAEVGLTYYSSGGPTKYDAATQKTACEAKSESTWFEAGKYVPTSVEKQTEYKGANTNTNTDVNTGTSAAVLSPDACRNTTRACSSEGSYQCLIYSGTAYASATATTMQCNGTGQTWLPNGGCPTTGLIGCCAIPAAFNAQIDQAFYASGFTSQTGPATCTQIGGTWHATIDM